MHMSSNRKEDQGVKCAPDSIVVDGRNVGDEHLCSLLGLSLRLIPHEPMLLIAGDDIDDNAIRLAQRSLHYAQKDKSACMLQVWVGTRCDDVLCESYSRQSFTHIV